MTHDDLFRALLSKLATDLEGLFSLLAPDAIAEFPYAASLGLPARVEGIEAIRRHFRDVMSRIGFANFEFTELRSYPGADGTSAWFEVHGSADLPGGKKYEQDYVVWLRSVDGKVAHYREYWNMVPIMELPR